jgi:YfiH family protein
VVQVDLGETVRAGFTMRAGGVSTGAYAALNLGLNVADATDDVLANRRIVERWAGGPIVFATQVHGAEVAVVAPPSGPAPTAIGPFDALVSASGAGLGVLVADCVPVLLADPEAGVVAAVHAGRRGLAGGVVQAALARMVELGARRGRVRAAVGPAICGACYEVPAALRAEVAGVVPAAWATTSWGTPALDLPAGVVATLVAAGVDRVQPLDICTLTDDRFYSHRRAQRSGETTGRSAGFIRTFTPDRGRVVPRIGAGTLLA